MFVGCGLSTLVLGRPARGSGLYIDEKRGFGFREVYRVESSGFSV